MKSTLQNVSFRVVLYILHGCVSKRNILPGSDLGVLHLSTIEYDTIKNIKRNLKFGTKLKYRDPYVET